MVLVHLLHHFDCLENTDYLKYSKNFADPQDPGAVIYWFGLPTLFYALLQSKHEHRRSIALVPTRRGILYLVDIIVIERPRQAGGKVEAKSTGG